MNGSKIFHPRNLVVSIPINRYYTSVLIVNVSVYALNVSYMGNIKIMMLKQYANLSLSSKQKWKAILINLKITLKDY